MGACALCLAAMLSLFMTADNCIYRCGFSVFLVQATTIMQVECNHDALGPKRARRRVVVKREEECMDFHDPMVTKVPRSLLSTTAGQKITVPPINRTYAFCNKTTTVMAHQKVEVPLVPGVQD